MSALRCKFWPIYGDFSALKIMKKLNCEDLKFCSKLGTYKNFTSKINSTLGVNFD